VCISLFEIDNVPYPSQTEFNGENARGEPLYLLALQKDKNTKYVMDKKVKSTSAMASSKDFSS